MFMKRTKNILFVGIFIIIICVCIAVISQRNGKIANIYVDEVLIQSIDLSKVKTPKKIRIGENNVALAEKNSIQMCEANCPDKLCIKQGKIHDGTYPIVCLPNKVVIRVDDK